MTMLERIDRRRLLAGTTLAAAGLAIPGLAPSGGRAAAAQEEAPRPGGTLILGLPVDVPNYNPFLAGGTHGYALARGVYNTLTRLDTDLAPQPELATDWSFSDDGLSLTLNLRPDVTFHSGRPFTAEDVAFTFEAVKSPEYAALIQALATPITVEVIDDLTVALTTETPYPAIFDAIDGAFIVDRETAAPDFPEVGVGTGPFVTGERVPGEYARFSRYDGYWGGPAPLDGFELRPIPDIAALALALETRTIDVAWRLNYRDYLRLAESSDYLASPGAEAALFYDIMASTTHPVLSDKRVRQAINWAIDRQRFVDIVLQGITPPTNLPYAKASIAYDADLDTTYSKDLERAQALIAEAGHPEGFSATILTSTKRNPGMIDLAQILQADLATIGVQLEIEDEEVAVYDTRFQGGDFELAVHTFGRANKDPATLFGGAVAWYTTPERNPSRFESDRYAELVEQGATTIDPEERKAIYRELTELILDESFTIPVAQQPRVWATLNDVADFAYSPDNMPLWHQIWLNR